MTALKRKPASSLKDSPKGSKYRAMFEQGMQDIRNVLNGKVAYNF